MHGLLKLSTTLLLLVGVANLACSQTVVLVDEDFESYADTAALNVVWGPANSAGQLVDDTFTEFLTFDDIFDGIPQNVGSRAFPSGGQGVAHTGSNVFEYLPTLNGGSPLLPTPTQNIVLQGDIFDTGNLGNKRMTIGLRSNSFQNFIELGHYNTESSEIANRTSLFPTTVDNPNPGWQFFDLPIELDREDDEDTVTTLADLGEAWHTYKATISENSILYEVDLFRDGSIDTSILTEVTTGPLGFDSLRIGSPSGSSTSSPGNGTYGGVIFDNIRLTLEDAIAGPLTGDYNGDGEVDAADYTVWRDNLGNAAMPPGSGADGDGDGNVTPLDYDFWADNYGNSNNSSASAAAAVPEPSSLILLSLAAGTFACGRSQKH